MMFSSSISKGAELLDELFAVARQSADPGLLLQAHHAAWTTLLNLPELIACRAHLEAGWALYRPDEHRAHRFIYGSHDAGACNRYTAAAALWPLGFPEQALAMAREAVSVARELSHPFSLVLALVLAATIYQHRREAEPARGDADAAIVVCAEYGIAPHLAAAGSILRGWAIAAGGQAVEGIAEIRGGLAALQPTGVRIRRPYYLGLLAEASAWAGEFEQGLTALAEAAAAVEETGERRWEAEIYRLMGELTVAREGGDRTEAEACFRRALEVAGRQSAKALELRAATSLARLWHHRLWFPVRPDRVARPAVDRDIAGPRRGLDPVLCARARGLGREQAPTAGNEGRGEGAFALHLQAGLVVRKNAVGAVKAEADRYAANVLPINGICCRHVTDAHGGCPPADVFIVLPSGERGADNSHPTSFGCEYGFLR
jgi:predicted ATPase